MTVSSATIPSATKARILVIGATGFMGQFVTKASLAFGHPTCLLVRPSHTMHSKAALLKSFQDKGATLIHGVINDKDQMERILKDNEIEIVISLVGGGNVLDQITLIDAMKSVKTIKRFLPSEFGHDVDRAEPVEPGLTMYKEKRVVRRMVEESGIPFTNICCNSIASWPYYDNCHPSKLPPPTDQFQIYGDGNIKVSCAAYFVDGNDIGRLTMKAVDDVRTLNKNVHFRPSMNCYSVNELASLWEKKIGRTIPRVTISEDDLLAAAAANLIPESIVASFTHDIFIKGCQVNFSTDGSNDVEIGTLYPDEKFRCLEDCFEDFVPMIRDKILGGPNDELAKTNNKSLLEAVPITAMG
ncbi:leucoanthocyanidin reductase isoform X1 [Arachis duranensis]|uniref:Leucoanthocyanidin reductase isoform X1 n=1 Tax=Arachis duranensis TaxID=130453 RepID=A0A9C6TKU4_ARADU|nr:leucoanthocyanidin reductase isoform X1 [Arachis duranensis]